MSLSRYGGDTALRREFIRILASIKRRQAQQACDACMPVVTPPSLDTASEPPSLPTTWIDPPPLADGEHQEVSAIRLS